MSSESLPFHLPPLPLLVLGHESLCGGAGRFVLAGVDVECIGLEVAVLKTFGRLRGFAPAFRGFAPSFIPTEGVIVMAATGLAENDKTTFSAPSSRFRPSSTGGGDSEEPEPEGPCSSPPVFARSICSAISKRSRCSSDIVERSFLSAASCDRTSGKRIWLSTSGFRMRDFLPASPEPSGCYQSKRETSPSPSRLPVQSQFFPDASRIRST
jgi:hypothetical protein